MVQVVGKTVSERVADLLARSATGEHSFGGAELTGAHLRGVSLAGADLTGAHLADAHLADADLSGADLRGAYLADADLAGADLTDADLRGADLLGANLSDAYLSRAGLSGADLMGANLAGADLTDADLTGANLAGADLSGVTMPRDSHDMIAELLYRAAANDPLRESMAGFILISRDYCWKDFLRLRVNFPAERVAWALDTLRAWPVYAQRIDALLPQTPIDTEAPNATNR